MKLSWLEGLPKLKGGGCPDRVEEPSFFSVRARESMDDSLFNDYVERVVLPLYPNINKTAKFDPNTSTLATLWNNNAAVFLKLKLLLTSLLVDTEAGKLLCGPLILKVDSGPGRMIANKASIIKRDEFFEMGLHILMGLPNATSVNQEMDALYGPFKTATYARGELILTKRLQMKGLQNSARAAAAATAEEEGKDNDDEDKVENANVVLDGPTVQVSMGFPDLATVVNGKQDDEIDNKPFDKFFTKERIVASWAKVGFVPFTQNCVHSKKVRHELAQRDVDYSLEQVKVVRQPC